MTADLFPEMQRTECPVLERARRKLERDYTRFARCIANGLDVNGSGPSALYQRIEWMIQARITQVTQLEREEASKR